MSDALNELKNQFGEKPSIAEAVYFLAYGYGAGAKAPRFDVMMCPQCRCEFVQIIRDTETAREFICHNCLQAWAVDKGIFEQSCVNAA